LITAWQTKRVVRKLVARCAAKLGWDVFHCQRPGKYVSLRVEFMMDGSAYAAMSSIEVAMITTIP